MHQQDNIWDQKPTLKFLIGRRFLGEMLLIYTKNKKKNTHIIVKRFTLKLIDSFVRHSNDVLRPMVF